MTDLSFAPATELTSLIRHRELSPTELVRHTLDRIATADTTINSVVALDPERALTEAAALEQRLAHGEYAGPLAGLPILVKDLEDAEGFPTARGTRAYQDRPPADRDSVHVARLRAAGALVIGKTNTPPLGAAVHTTNDAFGTTRNPWNPERTPGGSSGGAASAVAAGLVALATAGDGGGSTRIPAALCGIVGLKPSRGRIPHGPTRMPMWPQHACLTGMARTVRDTALHLDVAAGHHPTDPNSLPAPGLSYRDALEKPLPVLRIGVLRTLGVAAPRPEILMALDHTAGLLRDQGHDVRDDESPLPGADQFPAPFQLRQRVLAYARLLDVLDDFTVRRDTFEPWFAGLLDASLSLTPADQAAYWAHRAHLDRWAADLFDHYDLLLMPTTPTTAWPAEGPDIAAAVRERILPISYTAVFNDTGHPAISIPAGTAPDGLPLAVQLITPHHRDDLALTAAHTLERSLGTQHPPAFP
ncbi:amidase [Streptomyces sp. NPDC056723]|uniref:amidase n=1 Tax=Streptomyces sp. NPDC056723 TaxID=3345925 RepID=UPI003675F098